MPTHRCIIGAAISSMMASGILRILVRKIIFSLYSSGSAQHHKLFEKPILMSSVEFFGDALALIPFLILRRCKARRGSDYMELRGGEKSSLSEGWQFLYCGAPAAFGVIQLSFQNYAMMNLPVSIWQMLQGSAIVFTALLSVRMLGRDIHGFQYLGICLCVLGVGIGGVVHLANYHDGISPSSMADSFKQAVLVIGSVLIGQLTMSVGIIIEEKLLKDKDLDPMKVAGYSGVWGCAILVFVGFPICEVAPGGDNGHMEDIVDGIKMIKNSTDLGIVICLYLINEVVWETSRMAVVKELSAVQYKILAASRMIGVWLSALGVHYAINRKLTYGEAWTPYSPLQVVGFVSIVIGQLIYGSVFKLPQVTFRARHECSVNAESMAPSSNHKARNFSKWAMPTLLTVAPRCDEGDK